jgi:hypothetical protein
MRFTKNSLLVAVSAMALAAFALPAVASADYQGNDAFWLSDGSALGDPGDSVTGSGSATLTASNGITVTCDLAMTGDVWNPSSGSTGEDDVTGLTFSNCTTNLAPLGCIVTATANNLPWPTLLSEDSSGNVWDEIDNVDFTNTFTGLGCPANGAYTFTGTLNTQLGNVESTAPTQVGGVTCPNDPTKTGVRASFLGSSSGTLSGPGGLTATASGSVVICADDETALEAVGSL